MTGNPRFQIAPLADHDRSGFSCGVGPLDRYFREQATQDIKRLIASCFVLVDSLTGTVAGYYTLAATGISIDDMPMEVQKRLPRYPLVPAALIGRLAVDTRFRGQKLGSALLADAAWRVLRSDTRAFAIVVDAKDEEAASFYISHGFVRLPHRSGTLFAPLATLRKALETFRSG